MKFPRSEFLLEQGKLAAEILYSNVDDYYIDKRATSLESWPLEGGRVLIRIPTYGGLSARYYYCDGRELVPITVQNKMEIKTQVRFAVFLLHRVSSIFCDHDAFQHWRKENGLTGWEMK
jgi:hypothetical protein